MLEFRSITEENPIIQIIGVGRGDTSAVNHMHEHKMRQVEYVVCNTDDY